MSSLLGSHSRARTVIFLSASFPMAGVHNTCSRKFQKISTQIFLYDVGRYLQPTLMALLQEFQRLL